MYELVKLALENNGIIACKNPEHWRNIYPHNTFVQFSDTIRHVFNRPVYIYGLDEYLHGICKDIEGYCLTEEDN